MSPRKQEAARRLIVRVQKLKDEAKAKYDKADELSVRVGRLVGSGNQVRMNDRQVAVITDQFREGEDIVWAHGAARRWKIDIKAA